MSTAAQSPLDPCPNVAWTLQRHAESAAGDNSPAASAGSAELPRTNRSILESPGVVPGVTGPTSNVPTSNVPASTGPTVNSEPIPGYVLRERVGSGGFGEVWKAEAPGGLWKAIKFVYGTMDEARASQELRSLERIRDVHHPFLLSLERIEVVQSHLVIVSELAESCLKERFEQCRRDGLPGIPREELIGYLRDAADVLDYLYEKHSLQHLDVKPENLLLVGNHIKVADFGLLRNLDDLSKSAMAGLTPLYSPPEVLAGRPSRHSDQYSLAIVFQEMLTGEPPFGGRTTAQLAAQHLHSPPNVSVLAACDQPVVARALAKKPESRFASCRALIDALQAPTSKKVPVAAPRPGNTARSVRGVEKTAVINSDLNELAASNEQPLLPTWEEQLAPLDSISVDSRSVAYGPVIVLGIGGTGLRVLNRLRQRYTERLASRELPPAMRLLGMDTDTRALGAACSTKRGESLAPNETFAMPLRSAASYRTDARTFLEWLERKWLYNVPRSLQTDGLRPYGRLAMVDNSAKLLELLRKTIAQATAIESIASSEKITGLPFRATAPRIFLVASSSGGAGSGAVIDLAYAVRHLLHELHLPDSALSGLLVHATGRTSVQQDLAIANTCACLSELSDYGNAGRNYTAVPPLNISDFPEEVRAFQDTYLVHLGDGISDDEYDAGLERVADYLFLNTMTPAAAAFEQSRALEHLRMANDYSGARIRTVDLIRGPMQAATAVRTPEDLLLGALLEYWTEPPVAGTVAKSPFPDLEKSAGQFSEEKGLHFEPLLRHVAAQLQQLTNGDLETLATRLVTHIGTHASAPLQGAAVFDAIDGALGIREGQDEESPSLAMELAHRTKNGILAHAKEMESWLLQLVETPGVRVGGAKWATKWFASRLEKVHARAKTVVERTEDEIKSLRGRTTEFLSRQESRQESQRVDEVLRVYASLRVQQVLHRCLQHGVVLMMTQLNGAVSQWRSIADRLSKLSAQIVGSMSNRGIQLSGGGTQVSILKDHPSLMPEVVQMDRAISEKLASDQVTLFGWLQQSTNVEQTAAQIRDMIRKVSVRRTAVDETLSNADSDAKTLGNTEILTTPIPFGRCLPILHECGGLPRLIVVAPTEARNEDFSESLADLPNAPRTVVNDQDPQLVVCCEVEQIPLANVLAKLVGNRGDLLDVARRLHVRSDVPWSL